MKIVIFILIGTVAGAGSIGVYMGLKAKEQILLEQHQATEDSLAAIALASSQASDSTGEVPDVSEPTGSDGPSDDPEPTAPGEDTPEGDGEAGGAEDGEEAADSVEDPPSGGSSEETGSPDTGPGESTAAVGSAGGAGGRDAAAEDTLDLANQTNERLSKIFASMKAAEAAEVLSYLTDAEIERILLGIREKNAAPILEAMDPERAAAVSRRVLGSRRNNQ